MPPATIESLMQACRSDPSCNYEEIGSLREPVIHNVATRLPTADGSFRIHLFTDSKKKEHLALVKGDVSKAENVLTRVHSECLTGDALFSVVAA